MKWPPMKDSKAWAEMGDDIKLILKNMVFTSTKHKLKGLNEIVYQYGSDKFGTMVGHVQSQQAKGLSRRQKEIKKIRIELRGLKTKMENGKMESR